ncbi:MAG TPA: hypothetical protein VGO45_10335 [Bacteroidia bacterium]|jgi:hypothetical protein|nr:hypothetical protein [Bacteroidia bacterium]
MKAFITSLFILIAFASCHHRWREAYNPYLHSKHKPSEDIKRDYVKQDHWWRKKKNIQKIYFDRKN